MSCEMARLRVSHPGQYRGDFGLPAEKAKWETKDVCVNTPNNIQAMLARNGVRKYEKCLALPDFTFSAVYKVVDCQDADLLKDVVLLSEHGL